MKKTFKVMSIALVSLLTMTLFSFKNSAVNENALKNENSFKNVYLSTGNAQLTPALIQASARTFAVPEAIIARIWQKSSREVKLEDTKTTNNIKSASLLNAL